MNLLIVLNFISLVVAGIPRAYTPTPLSCGHHELEKTLRNIIDERLAKFHTNFYKDVAEWMSYLENFTTSKFSEHYMSIADELKDHRHHNRAVLNDIKNSCVHKREISANDYSTNAPNKARDLMAEAEAYRRRFFTESTTTTTTEPTTTSTTTTRPSVTDKTPNGAEFVAPDYDDFGESVPFFSSIESTTAEAVLRSPFRRNATAEEIAERAIMEGFRKLWNIV